MYQNEEASKRDYSDKAMLEAKSLYQDEKDGPQEEPPAKSKFEALVNMLRKEVQATNTLSSEVVKYCNSLSPMHPTGNKIITDDEQEYGVVGYIHTEIIKLQTTNGMLYDCVEHLKKVVGGGDNLTL